MVFTFTMLQQQKQIMEEIPIRVLCGWTVNAHKHTRAKKITEIASCPSIDMCHTSQMCVPPKMSVVSPFY